MNVLLDTHTFLWFVSGCDLISPKAVSIIEKHENRSFISIASLQELAIKLKLRKLKIRGTFDSIMDDIVNNGFAILPINFEHIAKNISLDFFHRDPFDRLLISQALVEKYDIISKDNVFDKYLKKQLLKGFGNLDF